MDRIIEVKVDGNYLSKDNKSAGVRGEANVTKLRITFADNWDGYAKKVTFWDAHGENPVERTLTTNYLENTVENTRVYLIPIPAEPMAEAGKLTFVIDGYTDGKRQRSISDKLEVKDAPIAENTGEPADPTPTQAEQLQEQIDSIMDEIQNVAIVGQKANGVKNHINYGDEDIYPSDESLFVFELSEDKSYYVLRELSDLYTTDITELVIPYEYNGLPVKKIGFWWNYDAFESCEPFVKGKGVLKKVILPDSITDMSAMLFNELVSLTEGRLSKNCPLQPATFLGCSSIKEIKLPENISEIPPQCFEGCTSLEKLKIPYGAYEISWGAFSGCVNLRLYIPDSVTSIDTDGLCDLKAIIISPDNEHLKERLSGYRINFSDVCVDDISDENTIKALKNLENYGDTTIFPSATNLFLFSKTQNPNGEQYATIYGLSDEYNADITELVIPYEYDGLPVKMVGWQLIYEEIDGEWIDEWYPVESGTIFEKGKDVLTKVVFPDSVTRVTGGILSDCTELKEVRFSKKADIPLGALMGCSSIEKVEIPEGQTNIGTQCFYNCSSLKELIVPNTVTSLYGFEIFAGCTNLTLHLSDSITFIEDVGDGYSMGFEDVKAIVISPNNEFLKEKLADYNLYFDYVGEDYAGEGGSDDSGNRGAIANLNNYDDTEIYPSNESWFVFEANEKWKYVNLMGLSDLYPEDITELVIPYEYNGLPVRYVGETNVLYAGRDALIKVILPDSIIDLDWNFFDGLHKLAEVRLPKHITQIPIACFYGCSSIKSINIPKGVEVLGESCFEGCSSLENLILPSGVTAIKRDAFRGCTNLDIYIPDSVTYIDADGLEDLKSITIPATNTYLMETLAEYDNAYIIGVRNGYYATTEQIGEISAALDELHTYAQALAGGEA